MISLLNVLHAQSLDAELTRCEDVAASFIARTKWILQPPSGTNHKTTSCLQMSQSELQNGYERVGR